MGSKNICCRNQVYTDFKAMWLLLSN